MSHIGRRDPATHKWPPLRTPAAGESNYRKRLEARDRAQQEDIVLVAEHETHGPGSWSIAGVMVFWIIVTFGIARCCG